MACLLCTAFSEAREYLQFWDGPAEGEAHGPWRSRKRFPKRKLQTSEDQGMAAGSYTKLAISVLNGGPVKNALKRFRLGVGGRHAFIPHSKSRRLPCRSGVAALSAVLPAPAGGLRLADSVVRLRGGLLFIAALLALLPTTVRASDTVGLFTACVHGRSAELTGVAVKTRNLSGLHWSLPYNLADDENLRSSDLRHGLEK
jgi:hypothetical protein